MNDDATASGPLPLIACHECGTVQHMRALPEGGAARCGRCGAMLYRQRRDSIEHTLLLTLAALILFVIANTFPFLTFELEGQRGHQHAAQRRQEPVPAGHVAARPAGPPDRDRGAARLAAEHGLRPPAALARPPAVGRRPGVPGHRAAAALGDDGGLPARRDRRLRQAVRSRQARAGHRAVRVRRPDRGDDRRRGGARAARDLAPARAAGLGPAARAPAGTGAGQLSQLRPAGDDAAAAGAGERRTVRAAAPPCTGASRTASPAPGRWW